eukprot:TRINITY_DN17103_c0_g1_i1.p1 TRINITY_DN17103_c0_g1~~TRINITY_DN17103_c0_g1_i1.p1  ORF type:complete len:193 (-),score=32.40 TRINITY_DN17103_c0_g1_i1:41-619(-)
MDNNNLHHHDLLRHPFVSFVGHTSIVFDIIELEDGTLVSFSKDATIMSASDDHTVRIWDVTAGGDHCLQVLTGHDYCVKALVVLSDGTLLSGSQDATIKEWDIKNGDCIGTFELNHGVVCMKAMKNGSIALGGIDGELQFRDTWVRKYQLVEICCETIARHHILFGDVKNLQQTIPSELYDLIISKIHRQLN